ncbi:MAG: hypothetical protein LBB77_01675 [Treponema sp.]|jgi:hypothetical protein|nr:hypothetical protein [Treponema sp.]
MSAGEDTMTPPEEDSFESLLDSTCSRLWERKLRYSLRRIQELAGILDTMDRELEEFLLCGKASGTGDFPGPPPLTVSPVETARAGSDAS